LYLGLTIEYEKEVPCCLIDSFLGEAFLVMVLDMVSFSLLTTAVTVVLYILFGLQLEIIDTNKDAFAVGNLILH
jgi:hypothetical protein